MSKVLYLTVIICVVNHNQLQYYAQLFGFLVYFLIETILYIIIVIILYIILVYKTVNKLLHPVPPIYIILYDITDLLL